MNLQDYTTGSAFLPHLKCDSLESAVRKLVLGLGTAGIVVDEDPLVAEVMRREKEGSTAVGGGLVIPHARFEGLTGVHIALATLDQPLEIPTEDGAPVDIVILLVGPHDDPRQMLRVLARLARLVKDEAFLDKVRAAGTVEDLNAAFDLESGSGRH